VGNGFFGHLGTIAASGEVPGKEGDSSSFRLEEPCASNVNKQLIAGVCARQEAGRYGAGLARIIMPGRALARLTRQSIA
jgi:hypothetical protein